MTDEAYKHKKEIFLLIAGAEVRSKVKDLGDRGVDVSTYDLMINELKNNLNLDRPLLFLISEAIDCKQEVDDKSNVMVSSQEE